MTRQYSDSIALAARRIVAASAVDITEPVSILPLARQLMAETGCGIDAAKRHVAKAIRLARHETITSPAWGGKRQPAGGRPKMKTFDSTKPIRKQLTAAVLAGEIEEDDLVWKDDAGAYVVDNGDFAGIDPDELSDNLREVGKVSDYTD